MTPAPSLPLPLPDYAEPVRQFLSAVDLPPLEGERVSLTDAWQRILASDILAPFELRNFDCSLSQGATVLHQGERLTSRETGLLAGLGFTEVEVIRRPRVALLSLGADLLELGEPYEPGRRFDCLSTLLGDAVRELGGEPVPFGIVRDDAETLLGLLKQALGCDAMVLSGGTSNGEGDLAFQGVRDLGPPGLLVQAGEVGLAAVRWWVPDLRTGVRTKMIPLALLPDSPTAAREAFATFVAPILGRLIGSREKPVEPR